MKGYPVVKKLLSLLLCTAILATALIFGGCADPRAAKYEKAISLLNSKNYAEAKALFAELGDYQDAATHLARFYFAPATATDKFDGKTFSVTFTYNEDNLPVRELHTDADGNVTDTFDYSYDEKGNLIREVWAEVGVGESVSEYRYDAKGNLTYESHSYPVETGRESYSSTNTYDENNRKIESRELWGDEELVCTYTYDEKGNLIREVVSGMGEGTDTYIYTYDENGKITRADVTYSDGSVGFSTYTYDARGNRTQEVHDFGDGRTATYNYTYDERNRLTDGDFVFLDGTTAHYTYVHDENDCLIRATFDDNGTEESVEMTYMLTYIEAPMSPQLEYILCYGIITKGE